MTPPHGEQLGPQHYLLWMRLTARWQWKTQVNPHHTSPHALLTLNPGGGPESQDFHLGPMPWDLSTCPPAALNTEGPALPVPG